MQDLPRMKLYYTTLLKSVQITRKTSTNIQQYSDSLLFVHLVICIVGNQFDKLTCVLDKIHIY